MYCHSCKTIHNIDKCCMSCVNKVLLNNKKEYIQWRMQVKNILLNKLKNNEPYIANIILNYAKKPYTYPQNVFIKHFKYSTYYYVCENCLNVY